jgi:hypothetical protein
MATASVGAEAVVPTARPRQLGPAVIETLQATADTHHPDDPMLWVQSQGRDPNLWRRRGHDALLHADASTALSELRVRKATYGPNAGRLQVVWTANLPAALYGTVGKVGTLPPARVRDALDLAVGEAVKHLPGLAPHTLRAWMPSRVDANGTWFLTGVDQTVLWSHLESAARTLDGAYRGRGRYEQPGVRSLRVHRTSEHLVRIYCKTSDARAKGVPLPQWLSESYGMLLRVEAQHVKRTCRKTYGATLEDLATDGARVSTNVLQGWLDDLGSVATARGPREVMARLVNSGMAPYRAAQLTMPALILRSGGVDAVERECGVSRRLANAWAAEIRSAVPDEGWSEVLGVPLSLDDVLTADQVVA